MGCKASKFSFVDDSIHAMIAHDAKVAAKHGRTEPIGYKPRAPHPLLSANDDDGMEGSRTNTEVTCCEEDKDESPTSSVNDIDQLLLMSANHNDIVDERDVLDAAYEKNALER